MKTLLKNINKFYKHYYITYPDLDKRLTKTDMYDDNLLMTVYEEIWDNMSYYDTTSAEYQWMSDLHNQLSDYITNIPNRPNHHKALAIFKLCVSAFGTMCIGAYLAMLIEYGADLTICSGIVFSIILAVLSGIGAYEDVKECE